MHHIVLKAKALSDIACVKSQQSAIALDTKA
jgi:hypothetical protein